MTEGTVETCWNEALAVLADSRNADGGWPYRVGQASALESTCLALLALSVTDDSTSAIDASVRWLTARQREDGLWPAADQHTEGSGFSPLAGLVLAAAGQAEATDRLTTALLDLPVHSFRPALPGVYGYDPQLRGWPWSPGDFSFVEPTCLAMLHLRRQGHTAHPRYREAVRYLADRALRGGGWNYGEPNVLGGDLYPAALPTALAVLALADEPDDPAAAGRAWLESEMASLSTWPSMGWSALALRISGSETDELTPTIAAWQQTPAARRDTLAAALCLLTLAPEENHPLRIEPA